MEEVLDVNRFELYKITPRLHISLCRLSQFFALHPNVDDTAVISLPSFEDFNCIAALAPYVLSSEKVLIITPSMGHATDLNDDLGSLRPNIYQSMGIASVEEMDSFLPNTYFVNKPLVLRNGMPLVNSKGSRLCRLVIVCVHNQAESIEDIETEYDLVIIHHAHKYSPMMWRNFINRFKPSRKLFITRELSGLNIQWEEFEIYNVWER